MTCFRTEQSARWALSKSISCELFLKNEIFIRFVHWRILDWTLFEKCPIYGSVFLCVYAIYGCNESQDWRRGEFFAEFEYTRTTFSVCYSMPSTFLKLDLNYFLIHWNQCPNVFIRWKFSFDWSISNEPFWCNQIKSIINLNSI